MHVRPFDHDTKIVAKHSRRNREGLVREMTRRINEAPMSAEELRRYIERCHTERRPADHQHNVWMQIAVASDHANQEAIRTLALYYRARAMALITVMDDGVADWVVTSSSDVNRHALFAAAAIEEMSIDDSGELVFDRAAFLRRVFELTQPALRPQ